MQETATLGRKEAVIRTVTFIKKNSVSPAPWVTLPSQSNSDYRVKDTHFVGNALYRSHKKSGGDTHTHTNWK